MRTTLSRLLRNPVYIGKVRQGAELFDGEQEAIINAALWDEVQRLLDENNLRSRSAKNKKSNALLTGLLYDDARCRMVPSHAKKGETLYHYYTSTPLMRGSNRKAGSVGRVSAPRIERQVLDALRNEAIAAPGSGDAKLLQKVEKIILHPAEFEILLKDSSKHAGVIRVAADLRSAKNGLRIIEEHGANQRSESLIRSLALSLDWRRRLERGEFKTVKALADAKGLSESYAWKLLRLSYLAPDIVEAILDGCQPSHLGLHKIYAAKFTGEWGSQRRALGFQ